MPSELLAMLSKRTREIALNEGLDGNQRFKAIVEELHWERQMSLAKMAKKLDIKHKTTLWRIVKRLNVQVRDKITALQLANTGRYKYLKRDFDGSDVEKLKMWFLVHYDGSAKRYGQQVLAVLFTPTHT